MLNHPCRWSLLLAAALASSVQAADTAAPASRWVFIPRVDLGASYDSNVYRTPEDATSDVYVEPEIRLDIASSQETNQWSLRGTGFYSHRAYAKEDQLDFDSFGEELRLALDGDGPGKLEVMESFRRVEDTDRHTPGNEFVRLTLETLQDINSLSARRDLLDVGAAYSQQLSDKSDAVLAYRYASVDYDEQVFLDLHSHLVQGEYAYAVSDKSSVFADAQYGAEDQDNGGESADVVRGRLGLQTRGAEKVVGRAGVGIQHYDRAREAGDESQDDVSFDLSLEWLVTEKVLAYGGVNNGSQLSSFYADNALDYVNSWMGLAYKWTPQATLGLRSSYRRDAYLDPVLDQGIERDRRDERMLAAARIDYQAPSARWGAFLQLAQEHVASNVDAVEYDDTRLTLEARMMY